MSSRDTEASGLSSDASTASSVIRSDSASWNLLCGFFSSSRMMTCSTSYGTCGAVSEAGVMAGAASLTWAISTAIGVVPRNGVLPPTSSYMMQPRL